MDETRKMEEQMELMLKTSGKLEYMSIMAAMFRELACHLWVGKKKFRVTFECDPKADRFKIIREELHEEFTESV